MFMMRKKEQARQRALTRGGGGMSWQRRQDRDEQAHNNAAFDGDGDDPHYAGVVDALRNPEYDPPMSPPQPAGAVYETVDETDYDVADAYPDEIQPANYEGLDGHTMYASSA